MSQRKDLSGAHRNAWLTASLVFGTAVVFLAGAVQIVRAQEGWQDEIYWFSTCLSMLRHVPPIPSVLADFPGTQSPLRFYGPTLFWVGAGFLKTFGVTLESWRSFAMVGLALYLLAIATLFWRVRRSASIAALAALVFSLSLFSTFALSRPGRPDAWGMAILVFAMATVARADAEDDVETARRDVLRWLLFGALLGLTATTSPRTWPLVFSMFVGAPILMARHRLRGLSSVAMGALGMAKLILLPIGLNVWTYFRYVRQASAHDAIDVSPLLGGSWDFRHASMQVAFYGSILVILGVTWLPRWRSLSRFSRWLLVFATVNLILSVLVLAGAINNTIYWGFPFEIAALLAVTSPAQNRIHVVARALAVALFLYTVGLRVAKEAPVYLHWDERNPVLEERALAALVPKGSIVYGSVSGPFFPALAAGSDFRYLRDWTTPGRSSVPGVVDTPAPMFEACHRPAYVVWSLGSDSAAMPEVAHASLDRAGDYTQATEQSGRLESLLARVPAARAAPDERSFSVYKLRMDPQYCAGAPSTVLGTSDSPRQSRVAAVVPLLGVTIHPRQ